MTAPETPGRAPAAPVTARPGSSPSGWLLIVGGAVLLAYLFRGLIVPLLLAAVLAYLLNPLVAWMQALAVRRSVAVTALFLCFGLLLLGSGLLLGPRLRAEGLALAANLPELTGRIEATVGRAAVEATTAYPWARRFLPGEISQEGWLGQLVEARAGHLSDVLQHAGTIVLVVLLLPLFTFFLLRDAGRMITFLMDRLHPVHVEASVAVWCEVDRIIGRYIRGLALDGIVVGILAALGLWAIGVPYPLLLGAFTALVNPLPYLCTVFSVGAAAVVALSAGQGLGTVAWILGLYLAIRLLDDTVIAVVTIGGSVHLHPVLIVASIIAGEHAFGLLGMVVAVPAVTVVKETARILLEHRRTLARAGLPPAGRPAPTPHYVC